MAAPCGDFFKGLGLRARFCPKLVRNFGARQRAQSFALGDPADHVLARGDYAVGHRSPVATESRANGAGSAACAPDDDAGAGDLCSGSLSPPYRKPAVYACAGAFCDRTSDRRGSFLEPDHHGVHSRRCVQRAVFWHLRRITCADPLFPQVSWNLLPASIDVGGLFCAQVCFAKGHRCIPETALRFSSVRRTVSARVSCSVAGPAED